MYLLRVILVDLLASFTDLLDDQGVLVLLDDALDLRSQVTRHDDEPVPIRQNPLVERGR
jgi:hypothetical protein